MDFLIILISLGVTVYFIRNALSPKELFRDADRVIDSVMEDVELGLIYWDDKKGEYVRDVARSLSHPKYKNRTGQQRFELDGWGVTAYGYKVKDNLYDDDEYERKEV